MRTVLLAALAAALSPAALAQPGLDVVVSGGAVARAFDAISLPVDGARVLSLSAALTPGLPRGLRVGGALTAGRGDGADDGRLLAAAAGLEAPLSGGRNGLYVTLGIALVAFEPGRTRACAEDPDCFSELITVDSYTGPAASVGVGARVPVGGRLWLEPAVSALVWDEALPQARLGLGWRLR